MRRNSLVSKFLVTTLSVATVLCSFPIVAFAEENPETETLNADAPEETYVLMVPDDGSEAVIVPEPIAEPILENVAQIQDSQLTQGVDDENLNQETNEPVEESLHSAETQTEEPLTEEITQIEESTDLKSANPNNPVSKADDHDEVPVDTDTTKNQTKLISVNQEVTIGSDKYQIILDGVTEANKDNLVAAIQQYYGTDNNKPLQFNNSLFVDAEKYYSENDGYDAEHCWAGAASDIIWKSGWAEGVINPLTNEAFKSEDEILTYYSTYFKDAGYTTKDGIKWFFNGISTAQGSDTSSAQLTTSANEKYTNYSKLTVAGTAQKAITELSGIVADNIIEAIVPEKNSVADKLSKISVLENLGTEIVAEVGVSWMNTTTKTLNGGHAIATAGLVINKAKTNLEKYVAILLADSDNSISKDTTGNPTDPDAATTTKSACQNSYTLYYLSQVTAADGKTYWQINGYSSGDTVGVIDDITTLQVKSNTDVTGVTETKGTKDALNSADLTVEHIFTRSENKDDIKSTFILNQEDIKIGVDIINQGYGTFQQGDGDASKLSNTLEIYKDGTLIRTVNLNYDITKDGRTINSHDTKKITWTLNKYIKSAGNYELKFTLNGKQNISEAYMLNNVTQTLNITVKEGTSSDIQKGITREQYANNKNLKGSRLTDFEDDDWDDEDAWLDEIIDWDTWSDEDIDAFFDYLDELDASAKYNVDDEDWTDELDDEYIDDIWAFAEPIMAKYKKPVITPLPVFSNYSPAAESTNVDAIVAVEAIAAVENVAVKAFDNTPKNGTVSYDSGYVSYISDSMIQKLAEREDVTTQIAFTYNNVKYVMTIPAHSDFSYLLANLYKRYGYFDLAKLIKGVTINKA